MSLVISDDLVKASGFSENELFLEIVLMLFRQDKISLGKASELVGLHPSDAVSKTVGRSRYLCSL
ncbi:UPF0175 family protein [Chlorogloeopsis sp. ULAP01]|uniref:UPF0175 family protein n=1 Tax=Chlorogloeopsis sp. ULAP01 TaxID=3056483 RepID=UPI0025AA8B2B|nr:UPF0175 family protein [Chlorogloeopsis sp. ULAP01]MDM9384546.1 UPF0175 family protein [Chlorogloeopsis sp. ULAP01]